MAPTMSEEEFLELLSIPTSFASPETINTELIPSFPLDYEFSPPHTDMHPLDLDMQTGNGTTSFPSATSIGMQNILLPPTPPVAPQLQDAYDFNLMGQECRSNVTNDLLYRLMERVENLENNQAASNAKLDQMKAALGENHEELSGQALHSDAKLDQMTARMENFGKTQEELRGQVLHSNAKLDKMKAGMEIFARDVYNWIGPGSLVTSPIASDAFEIGTPGRDSSHCGEEAADARSDEKEPGEVMWADGVSWEDMEA